MLVATMFLGITVLYPAHASTPSVDQMFDHIVTIVLENTGLANICGLSYPCNGGTGAPYMASLANNNSLAWNYATAKSPPMITNSLPNYLALTSGQTFASWSNTDCNPGPACSTNATNIVDRLESASLTWKAFAEDYPISSGCYAGGDLGSFISHHLPFNYYTDISGPRCSSLVSAGAGLADSVFMNYLNSSGQANYIWLTPNKCDDGHDPCSKVGNVATSCAANPAGGYLCQQEAYLEQIVPRILATSMFTQQRSVLFVTYDEGGNYCPARGGPPDCVYAVYVGAGVKSHYTSVQGYSHYSALATLEANWGMPCIALDCSAQPMNEFFNPTLDLGLQGGFEGYTLTTTGWLAYNSSHVINGALSLGAALGPTVLANTTYSIRTQLIGGNGVVRFILSGRVSDQSGIALAAYIYMNTLTGTVSGYFVARTPGSGGGSMIGIVDISYIILRYGSCEGDSRYDPRADLLARGCVDLVSVSLVDLMYGSAVYS
jgi:hypothetical protein